MESKQNEFLSTFDKDNEKNYYGDKESPYEAIKIINNLDLNFQNPCDWPMLRKLFRPTVTVSWSILDKETRDII